MLVGNLEEDRAAITCLCLADDHTFFATGAEDGAIKVWDSAAVTAPGSSGGGMRVGAGAGSKLAYSLPGKITAMAACHGTMALAAASDTGAMHVLRVAAAELQRHDNRPRRRL